MKNQKKSFSMKKRRLILLNKKASLITKTSKMCDFNELLIYKCKFIVRQMTDMNARLNSEIETIFLIK